MSSYATMFQNDAKWHKKLEIHRKSEKQQLPDTPKESMYRHLLVKIREISKRIEANLTIDIQLFCKVPETEMYIITKNFCFTFLVRKKYASIFIVFQNKLFQNSILIFRKINIFQIL